MLWKTTRPWHAVRTVSRHHSACCVLLHTVLLMPTSTASRAALQGREAVVATGLWLLATTCHRPTSGADLSCGLNAQARS